MTLATRDWFCRTFQWGCHGNSHGSGGIAPEIGDTWALVLGISFVVGVTAILVDQRKGRRRGDD